MGVGVYAKLIDFDRLYESISNRAILVNKFNMRSDEDKEELNKLLYSEYEGDALETAPSCDCGKLKGDFNLGTQCIPLHAGDSACYTIVSPVTERPLESILWMRVPDGVHSFISPAAWTLMCKQFTHKKIILPRWLADPSYQPKGVNNLMDIPIIQAFRDAGWVRGINHFIEHFDLAMQIISDHRVVTPAPNRFTMEQFIAENKSKFFPKYLPIPNRAIFITEKTALGTYADEIMHSAIDAVHTITTIETSLTPATQRVKEGRTIRAIQQLSDYYNNFKRNNLSKKTGLFRRQVYGSRLDFSARAVISAITDKHRYDDLYLPWGLSIQLFKTHITNKLLKKGMTPNECEDFIMSHTLKYHPMMEQILNELIDESPNKRLPIVFQRNPTLERGSAQLLGVPRVKTDVSDKTISMSPLALAAPNADYDGDEMNAFYCKDQREYMAFQRLEPHLGVMDTDTPFKVSGNIKIPGPVMNTFVNWMHEFD